MLVETGAIQRGLEGWVAREGSAQLADPADGPGPRRLAPGRPASSRSAAVVDPASVIGLSFPMDAVAELVDEPVRPRLGADLDVLMPSSSSGAAAAMTT